MFYTILLAIAFIFVTYYRYKKIKNFDVSIILLMLYSLVAILCVYELSISSAVFMFNTWDLSKWDIRLWPYIYLFVVFLLFMRPLFRYSSDDYTSKLYINSRMQSLLILLSIIYVLCSLLSVYYSLASFTYTFQDADFAEIYEEEEVEQYANFIDGIAKRYTEYFRPMMFLSVFYFLFEKRCYKLFFTFVFVISVFCSLMICALNASRGGAFNLVMMVLMCMVMFWRHIDKKERKRLFVIGSLITLIFIGYSYLVTVARFEDDSTSSVLFYFGHSFIAFNYGIAGRLPSLSYGTYVFDWFLPFLGINSIPSPTPKVEYLFYTFIGSLYKDFGGVGTLMVSIIFPAFISILLRPRKNKIDIASLYIYLFYIWRLMSGVFVYGRAEGFLWFVAILIFVFLRFLSNSSSNNNIVKKV